MAGDSRLTSKVSRSLALHAIGQFERCEDLALELAGFRRLFASLVEQLNVSSRSRCRSSETRGFPSWRLDSSNQRQRRSLIGRGEKLEVKRGVPLSQNRPGLMTRYP